jgi:DNA-binding beta-propeller fold protein YncE
MLMILSTGSPAGTNDVQYAFNRPSSLSFLPNGDFLVADGYGNSRVVHFTHDGEYVGQWGTKGAGDGEFDLVHDVAIDVRGRVYVADRRNQRVQVFDQQGRFLDKWTDLGVIQGLYYVEREDALYMTDGPNSRIIRVNMDGQVTNERGNTGHTDSRATGSSSRIDALR